MTEPELTFAVENLRIRMRDKEAVDRYEAKLDKEARYVREYNMWLVKQLQKHTLRGRSRIW